MSADDRAERGVGGALLALGEAGYLLAFLVLVGFSGFKLLGVREIGALLPVAVAATLGILAWTIVRRGGTWKRGLGTAVLFAFGLLASIHLAGLLDDNSFDGRWYHQEAVLQLSAGWDPTRETLREDSIAPGVWSVHERGDSTKSAAFWVNRYPKASEILGASVYSLVGRLEPGKAFNLVLLLSAFCLVAGACLRVLPGLPPVWFALVCLGGVSCPLAINQAWTYLLDGQLYLLLVGFGTFLILALREDSRRWWFAAGAAFVVLANLKFTGLIDGLLLAGVAFLHLVVRRRWSTLARLVAWGSAASIVGIAGVGWNPYVRNTLEHGHPLHPLMGRGSVEIMSTVSPPRFNERNRVVKFLQANLARTEHLLPKDGSAPPVKVPFSLAAFEIEALALPDARQAGFGPFYAPILLIAFGMYAVVAFRRWRRPGPTLSLRERLAVVDWIDWSVLAIVSTMLINPEFWWSRYVPQAWLLPLLFGLSVALHASARARMAAAGVLLVHLSPMVLALPWMLGAGVRTTLQSDHEARCLADAPGTLIHYGQLVSDREKFRSPGFALKPVAFQSELVGPYVDTLVMREIVSSSTPSLRECLASRPRGLFEALRRGGMRDRIAWFAR